MKQASLKTRKNRTFSPLVIAVAILLVPTFFISIGCSNTAGSQATTSTKTLPVTTTTPITTKTTAVPSSTASNAITKSGSGVPVTDSSVLLGSWAEIKTDNYIGGMTQTRTYSTNGPDAYIFLFDKININETHGGSTNYSGEWTFNNGTITMKDNGFGARPIVYSDVRLKDGLLTAIYQDKDLTQVLTWQKLN